MDSLPMGGSLSGRKRVTGRVQGQGQFFRNPCNVLDPNNPCWFDIPAATGGLAYHVMNRTPGKVKLFEDS